MTVGTLSRCTVRRAAIYCRISLDRAGAGLGVARQQEDCRALADRLGWPVADVYVDNDVSAYSGKPRPAWQRLLGQVESGAVDAVLCWHVDRLTRSPRELEDVIDLADRHGLALATVTGDIDLATPTGRMVARLLGASARYESEHKGERQRRQIRQFAEAGHQTATGRRPYGYALVGHDGRRITATVDPVEGPIVVDCARRVLAGESIASITRGLNDCGVLTSQGNGWTRTTLRRMLCSARISGRREHIPAGSYTTTRPLVGEIVSTESDWPEIISVADSDRIRALLTRPDRRLTTGGARKHLLSGILHCARCGHPMVGRSSRGVLRYVCNRNPDGGKGACGRMYITAAPVDEHVRDLVLTALDSPEMVPRLRQRDQPEPDLHTRIRADEDELDTLAADHGNGEISRSEWKAARAPIVARLDAARERLATSTGTTALSTFTGTAEEMRARWDAANVSQRRAVITAVLEKVMVHPAAVMGRNRFDPDRLEPLWRV